MGGQPDELGREEDLGEEDRQEPLGPQHLPTEGCGDCHHSELKGLSIVVLI